MLEFILNGAAHGNTAMRLLDCGLDPNVLRPWLGDDGQSYITVNRGGEYESFVTNAPALLRKDEWIQLDTAVIRVAKQRLRAFADLRSRGLTYNVPNAMGKTVLQYQAISDITSATISMDGLRQSEEDRPAFELRNLPLPIVHKDFSFTMRELATARESSSPLDTTTAELAGRRVAEEVEKLLLGVSSTYSYGGGTVYGYTNFPQRITTVSLTDPTGGGWNGGTLVGEILEMVQAAYDANYYGPFALYFSRGWSRFLDEDYSTAKGDNTVRQRLTNIEGLEFVRTLDYLTGYQAILVQLSPDVVRAVLGMDITTLQWESHGGMRLHFKVMAIQVPQLRSDYEEAAGVVHAQAA